MSPAAGAKGKKGNAITIEFSGICTLVWDAKGGRAKVHLVDLGSAGFQRHYAALGMEVTRTSPKGVKGPDADAAISVLGQDKDIGLWNLLGCDVEIVGGTGKLTVDDSNVDVSKKPGATAKSVKWLPDVSFLCESKTVDPVCPTAAVINLPVGHITAHRVIETGKVEFVADGQPVGPERFCLSRFRAVVPFEDQIALQLSRQRVLRFAQSATLMISNTCVCELGAPSPPDHFYGHYEVVKAKRRPTVQPAGKLPKFPGFPEWCYPALVRVS
jgi:hypothetical protein